MRRGMLSQSSENSIFNAACPFLCINTGKTSLKRIFQDIEKFRSHIWRKAKGSQGHALSSTKIFTWQLTSHAFYIKWFLFHQIVKDLVGQKILHCHSNKKIRWWTFYQWPEPYLKYIILQTQHSWKVRFHDMTRCRTKKL